MTWKPLFPHRSKLLVRLNKQPPVEGLYQPCAIPLSQLTVHCLLSLNGLPAHSRQHLSPSSPNSPREQLLVLWVIVVVFAQLHQLTKKNFTSEVSLCYIFQGKHVLLVNDSSGPTLSSEKVPHWGEGDAAEHARYLKKAFGSLRDRCPQTVYTKAVWACTLYICAGGDDQKLVHGSARWLVSMTDPWTCGEGNARRGT